MQIYSIFLMFWTFLPSIIIRTPWGIVSVKGGVAENHAVLPKMPILLRPYKLKTYIYTFKIEIISRPCFTNMMTGIFHFLMFWTLPSSCMIKTPRGIISVSGGVARKKKKKKHVFLLKMLILLRP